MAIVQSFGAVQRVRSAVGTRESAVPSTWALSQAGPETYINIYRTQPSVRTVVDFLARNVAELNLHAYRRVSDTDRERLRDHESIDWIENPNPATTSYKLWERTMLDMGIHYRHYWLKVRRPDRIGFVRLPPETIDTEGWLLPDRYIWTRPDGVRVPLAPNELVAYEGFDPSNPIGSLSPLETLRRTLAEECASNDYRERFWKNAARLEGVIERPKDAPRWTAEQKQTWREQWNSRFAGSPGQIAVLEDGMQFKPTSYSAVESEYISARKLTREEVAAAYHVPLPMVGILEYATFANVKEQHKQLYQDTLGPWLKFLQLEIRRQVLYECDDQDRVYYEFNIAEKLKGSFEEQGAVLQTLVGRPILTGNEGRARLNLPAMKNDPSMDEVAKALNAAKEPANTAGSTKGQGDSNATRQGERAELELVREVA